MGSTEQAGVVVESNWNNVNGSFKQCADGTEG